MKLYLLPGLGADHRLYGRCDLGDHSIQYLDWPEMTEDATVKAYATELSKKVDPKEEHAYVGVSMGGLVAQDLVAITGARIVILISSWRDLEEVPTAIRIMRNTHPERALNKTIFEASLPVVRWQMGVETEEETALFNDLVKAHSIEQIKAQMHACLAWNGPPKHDARVVHIHGDKDRLMPISSIKEALVVEGGTHFMVFGKAHEVSALVRDALEREA